MRLAHDVARRRGRQLVGDEGEHHEVLRGVGERQRSRIGARVGDPRVVRDNVYPRGILALAKLREPPRHRQPVWKSKFYGAFVLNRRVDLHAIDATPARWRGDAGSSPLEHPTHWLISTQVPALLPRLAGPLRAALADPDADVCGFALTVLAPLAELCGAALEQFLDRLLPPVARRCGGRGKLAAAALDALRRVEESCPGAGAKIRRKVPAYR